MALLQCSRCGRQQRHDDAFGASQSASAGMAALPPAWASFEGLDVCPDCQTALERTQTAKRALAFVEAGMERRRRASMPPDAAESALVSFALSLRDALEVAPRV